MKINRFYKYWLIGCSLWLFITLAIITLAYKKLLSGYNVDYLVSFIFGLIPLIWTLAEFDKISHELVGIIIWILQFLFIFYIGYPISKSVHRIKVLFFIILIVIALTIYNHYYFEQLGKMAV